MNNFYKGGRGLAFSQREGGACSRKEKPPRLSKILTNQVREGGIALPSATVREVVDVSSGHPRDLFGPCSGDLREVFGSCSENPEQYPKNTHRNTEGVSNQFRSVVEAHPKETRTAPEEAKSFSRRFLGKLKARIKYRCSKDVVPFTQRLRKIAEVPLMYHECTVSVRGVYRKGTGDLLRSYWRSTTDLLNACTSGVDQRYSNRRGIIGVEAMKNKSMPLVLALICFMLFNLSEAWAQSAETRTAEGQKTVLLGEVLSSVDGEPIQGVSVRANGVSVSTDEMGRFRIPTNKSTGTVEVRHVGFQPQAIDYDERTTYLTISLEPLENQLEEVEVVSTGYQQLPKERATGSFAHVDSKTLQRNPSMDILSRLDGVTNGLLLDRNTGNPDGISVRGRSTLFSSTRPLVVVDNFPFEGDINNINPNDIESVTVLKDATAASIWGVRSGNGVIVITTKKAKDRLSIDFSSNFLIGKKPNLFYEKQMSSSDFIDSEIWLFEQGYYDRNINTIYQHISPVVDILEQNRSGDISLEEAHGKIDVLRSQDVRHDFQQYFYRNKLQHQQQVSISTGSTKAKNILSVGYDRSLSESVSAENSRVNIRNNNQWSPFGDYLRIDMDVWYVKNTNNEGNAYGYRPRYPYEQLAHNNIALEAANLSTLRPSYTDTVGNGYLLDWKYRPVEEVRDNLTRYEGKDQQLRFQVGINSKVYRSFKIGVNYLTSNNWLENSTLYDQRSFYTRNLINQYSQVDEVQGTVVRPIARGDILNKSTTRMESHYGRAQLDWNENLGHLHHFSGMVGMEWRHDRRLFENLGSMYGYNRDLESFTEVDIFTYFPLYHSGGYSLINRGAGRSRQADNNRSYYGLLSYTYADNLSITGSFRKDESNIFGVSANQKGVPLWSVGASYNLHPILKWMPLDFLKIRTTFGYNGNVDKSTTAYLTSRLHRAGNLWGSPIDIILNPPNSSLRWERVQNQNIGLDFSLGDNRVGGSIEYFVKKGQDLMGWSPVAPQVGISEFYGNVASTATKGLDAQLWFSWFKDKAISVRTDLIFNAVNDKITEYYIEPGSNSDIVSSIGIVPIEGNPINSLVLYGFKGLSNEGNPLGFFEGEDTENYGDILNGTDRNSISLLGSKVPTRFGSFRHTVSYRNLELSFNILYKFGYYFKRTNSFSSNGLIGGNYRYADYDDRWQHGGDENRTSVPAFQYPINANRESFYQNSSVLALTGSHIRLQDLRFSYAFKPFGSHRASSLQLYTYCSNIALLWKENDQGIDPAFHNGYPTPFEISFGAKFNY
ncbi:SusC/RagA family TonB-linked outer membrane protein [Sphingobacterium arenae]|uniref:SusC/RagA family TonB-linked outer membrane protein n=1 Tax=Sphingobacterium arenae TaxID=1280598 RepID=A0ABR7Y2Y7_9SPHI|nr:SusC/RagA family TonB-linked outer membrane protein [Sphingobacterium arenae]MBD1425661.1 SusC/RagA family TonB-linked outer membrane protein [Sphingobacterium arenae]